MVANTLQNDYLAGLLAAADALPMSPFGQVLRAEAATALGGMRWPTTRDEAYRFLNLKPLMEVPFAFAGTQPAAVADDAAERFAVPETVARLTFVDGIFAPALSDLAGLGAGVTLVPLAQANEGLLSQLGTAADLGHDVFAALNTRHLNDGALLHLGRNAVLDAPVHLLFLNSAGEVPLASYPRVLVVAEPGAQATLLEVYASLGKGTAFSAPVTEVLVGENAQLTHIRVQDECQQCFQVARLAARLARYGRYHLKTVSAGGRLTRLNVDVAVTGEGAEATLNGLTLIHDNQEADTHTSVEHLVPNSTSQQLNKNVVAGAAHAVFNGRVFVAKGAVGTDSQQSSRNLLLSEKARVDTKPELEIFADDVKCAHGATVGQLEGDEVFYLRSRGLDAEAARNLLTFAFAGEIIDQIPIPSLRERLQALVMAQTDRGS